MIIKFNTFEIIDGDRGVNYPNKNELKASGYCVFLNAKNITKNGFSDKCCEFISEIKYNELRKGIVLENDIIITTRGTIGNIVLIDKNIKEKYPNIRINSGMVIIRSKDINPEFLYMILKSKMFENKLKEITSGGVLPQLTIKDIKNIEISINIKNEISYLNLMNKNIKHLSNIEKLLEKIEIRNQYYADKLLSGELNIDNMNSNIEYKDVFMNNRNTKININFNIKKIKDIFNVSRGKVISKEYIENNKGIYPVYSSATLNNGEIGKINTYQLDGKYITWTTDGVYAGSVFYRDGKFNCTNICGILDIKTKGNLKYFSIILKSYLPLFVTKLGNSKLMSNTVEEIEIPFTSNIDEQNKIANFMEKLENEKTKIEELLKLEEKRFEWLSDKLLSGEYIIED